MIRFATRAYFIHGPWMECRMLGRRDGKVGVGPVCVLGLNEQRIKWQAEINECVGFAKFYHELAHNAHGDHDDKFYWLMRQTEPHLQEQSSIAPSQRLGGKLSGPISREQRAAVDSTIYGSQVVVQILWGVRFELTLNQVQPMVSTPL